MTTMKTGINLASMAACVAVILAGLAPCNCAFAQQRRKILVAYVAPGLTQALPWIAKEAGLFAKHGIDAEVLLLTGSPRMKTSRMSYSEAESSNGRLTVRPERKNTFSPEETLRVIPWGLF